MVALNGYKICRADRPGRTGGGLAIYIHNSFQSKIIFKSLCNSWEILAVEIGTPNFPIALISVYRCAATFKDPDLSLLSGLLDPVISYYPRFFLGGDFNIDLKTSSPLSRQLSDLLSEKNLTVSNSQPTRLGPNSATLIDLLISPMSFSPTVTGQCPGIADHEILAASFDVLKPPPGRSRFFRNFAAISPEALGSDADNIDWSPSTPLLIPIGPPLSSPIKFRLYSIAMSPLKPVEKKVFMTASWTPARSLLHARFEILRMPIGAEPKTSPIITTSTNLEDRPTI